MLNVGRMGPKERRRRQIEAEQFTANIIHDMTDDSNTNIYVVQSFTDQSLVYEIELSEHKMISCKCKDFGYNNLVNTCIF